MLKFREMIFYNNPQVYEPADDTFLLIDNLQVKSRDRVLEIGTGTGIVAVMASFLASWVIATDINPEALNCATKNLITNRRYNIELREGNLFEPVSDEKFDIIIFNTPYLPTEEDEGNDGDLEAAWDGGIDGREIIDPFLESVKAYLNPEGRLQMVQSSLSDEKKTLNKLKELGFKAEVLARKKCFFEEILVINAVLDE
jgi:release factor glutamine methyltransferase